VIHHHHHIEEDFYFDGFKGAIDKSGIVHEHDGFRSRIDDIKAYLESCLPGGTKWGPYADVVPATSPNNKFDSASLLKLIDALTEAFLQHVCLIPTRNPCQNCLLTDFDFVIDQFCDEIGYLEPSKIRNYLSHEEMVAVNKRILDHILAQVRRIPNVYRCNAC
jgi:hypothetical protein